VLFASLVDDPSECVAELMKDSAKRKAAEKELKGRKKLWDEQTATLAKALAGGISAPPPGPEPKLADIVAEIERERLFGIIRDLVKWENSNNETVLQTARAEILRSCNGKPPPVYDPFCGGGSIPLEAQRLGLEAHASDLNPVPVLINKALIEIPPKFAGKPPVNPEAKKKLSASGSWKGAAGLAEDIRYYGLWMRHEAEKRIGHLYPKVKLPKELGGGEATVIAWLWARTVASPNPAAKGAHVPLVRSFWLSTKADKKVRVEPIVDQATMTYHFEVRTGNGEPHAGTVSRNGGLCLLTGSPMPLEYVRAEGKAGRIGARLMAIVAEGSSGRIYLPPVNEHERVARSAEPHDVPDTDLPEQALGFRVQNYGMTKHRHLFTNRQLVALTTFCDLVGEARAKAFADSGGDHKYADAVATYLGLGVGRLSDICNALCSWETSKTQVRHLFTRQAISMLWDFGENNIFGEAAGDFGVSLGNLCRAVSNVPSYGVGLVQQLNAEVLLNDEPRLFSTDPPYYDNVPYADLSDFFYVWLRRCLQPFYPQLLGTLLVPKAEELIAEPFRHGGKDEARSFFELGMGRVFKRMREATDPRFPTTIYYAFKQAEGEDEDDEVGEDSNTSRASTGWETFLQGLIDAGWQIDGTWPMRTELSNRMRGQLSNALASSIVLVCRVRTKEADTVSRRDFLTALKKELPDALRAMQKSNIAPVDLAQAAIGPGMAVFSRYARVLETDGSAMMVRTALTEINKSLDEVLAEQEGEFDADTRWALAWFDQNGFNEGPYGVAETLCTAKNTSVAGMVEANILAAKGGKVRLLKREELDADWNPATDKRLTIWEITHHLIRRLEQGESGAAELIRQLGAKAEVARDLSYRLYTICERRKWAQEAIAYNTLVLSWGDVQRLAGEIKVAAPSQGEMTL
jgi:putative DNA methylase